MSGSGRTSVENGRAAPARPSDERDHSDETDKLPRAFDRTVSEGERRLERGWPELLATGAVGGIDVSIGVFALLTVQARTGNEVVSSLAFGIGFVALALAGSELFTENFLVPIAALVAGRSRWGNLLRLWVGALTMNLLGGWVMTGVIDGAAPYVRPVARQLGEHYVSLGIGWTSFAAAIAGGAVITLMTWMQHSTDTVGPRLVAAVCAAFLLAIGPLNHAIVVSLEMFAGLQAGAPYGYLDWLRLLGWASLGNIIGGVGLVTVLRLVQVGKRTIEQEQAQSRTAS